MLKLLKRKMSSRKISDFLKESHDRSKKNQDSFQLFNSIPVSLLKKLPDNVDFTKVAFLVEEKIPLHLTNNIEAIYITHLKEFDTRNINAMFKDGVIYVSNQQDDVDDMVDDIIHEISHAVEEFYAMVLYSDGKIQNEFLGKRQRMKDILDSYGYIEDQDLPFDELEYSKNLDDFLYRDLGYDKLETLCLGLFVTPYAATSVREYFATAFEEYLLHNAGYVKRISPAVYAKLETIVMLEV